MLNTFVPEKLLLQNLAQYLQLIKVDR